MFVLPFCFIDSKVNVMSFQALLSDSKKIMVQLAWLEDEAL